MSIEALVRTYRSAGRTWSSQAASEWRNDATMIAIETSRLTAATMVASESIDCPGAPWSCSAARRAGTGRRTGMRPNTAAASRGISMIVPMSSSAIAR